MIWNIVVSNNPTPQFLIARVFVSCNSSKTRFGPVPIPGIAPPAFRSLLAWDGRTVRIDIGENALQRVRSKIHNRDVDATRFVQRFRWLNFPSASHIMRHVNLQGAVCKCKPWPQLLLHYCSNMFTIYSSCCKVVDVINRWISSPIAIAFCTAG